MKYPTPSRRAAYTGSRRHIQPVYVYPTCTASSTARPFRAPTVLFALMMFMLATFVVSYLSSPAYAIENDPLTQNIENTQNIASAQYLADPAPQPTAAKTLNLATTTVNTPDAAPPAPATTTAKTDDATRSYISCPIEIYRGTLYDNQPAEYLVDDFEDIPEHWLYVLSPLEEGENYFFTLDLSCHTENSPFQGEISAVYSSYIPDDGSLGSVRIEATEQIAPDLYLVYYGELKYISDCSSLISSPDDSAALYLTQNGYGQFYDHHLFYFSLTTADFPDNAQPLSEQRMSRLSDPAASALVSIIGDTEHLSSVYDEDLLQSDYMYPYRKYDPAEGSQPPTDTSTPNGLSAPAAVSLSANITSDSVSVDPPPLAQPAPSLELVELSALSADLIYF